MANVDLDAWPWRHKASHPYSCQDAMCVACMKEAQRRTSPKEDC